MLEWGSHSMLGLAVVALLAGGANAQTNGTDRGTADEPILKACQGIEHRQFDFWLGSWEVTDTTGKVVGSNEITRVANGCALQEYWRSASGPTGTSLNFYDPATGQWHQFWAGLGVYLRLSGGIEGDRMVLSGERQSERGPVVDRVTWVPGEDGTVRQIWDVSSDGGASWQTIFDGLYNHR
jgi:hypothetical protein